MLLFLSLALLATAPVDQDVERRTPAEAFVTGLERVCPIYTKLDGLTPEDERVLTLETQQRVGTTAVLRQADAARMVQMEGAPGACTVILRSSMDGPLDDLTVESVKAGMDQRFSRPSSGWRSVSPQEIGSPGGDGLAWISDDGARRLLFSASEEAAVGMMVFTDSPFGQDDPVEARRLAAARPTDLAMVEAMDGLCAVVTPSTRAAIDQGEVFIRHAGDSRLTVDYVLNGDCTVTAQGEDAADVAAALMVRLDATGSGWTQASHAWTAPNPYTGQGQNGLEANYRHTDGREAIVILGEGLVRFQLWRPRTGR